MHQRGTEDPAERLQQKPETAKETDE
uniref:Uncharacterized protein n=1 Tax=Anguilla anguilla TaxID=7936 RepID=A0A0E9PK77_ANGAN